MTIYISSWKNRYILSYKPFFFFLFYLTTFSKQQNQITYFKLYLIKISIFIISSLFITIKIKMGLKGIIYHPLLYCLHLTKNKEINKKTERQSSTYLSKPSFCIYFFPSRAFKYMMLTVMKRIWHRATRSQIYIYIYIWWCRK